MVGSMDDVWMCGWMCGWMDVWMYDGGMDGCMDVWMYGSLRYFAKKSIVYPSNPPRTNISARAK